MLFVNLCAVNWLMLTGCLDVIFLPDEACNLMLPLQVTLAAEKKTGIFKLHGRVPIVFSVHLAFFFALDGLE
jgi:hypothetical protein